MSRAFTLEAFKRELAHRTTKIKPLLLNQEYVVGLGNIYVDEALFTAGFIPSDTADTLKPRSGYGYTTLFVNARPRG